jgi:hypothetical protein
VGAGSQATTRDGATVAQRLRRFRHEGQACACFNLRKAARAVTQLYDEAMRPTGLRANQVSLLGVTQALQPVTVSKASEFFSANRCSYTYNSPCPHVYMLTSDGLAMWKEGS